VLSTDEQLCLPWTEQIHGHAQVHLMPMHSLMDDKACMQSKQ